MRRPGVTLRAIASRVCSAQTMERVIDPLIADLQAEHAGANREGHLWRGRWIRLAAGAALLKVMLLCGARYVVSSEKLTIDDHRAMIRTVAFSAVATCAVMAVLVAKPLWSTLRVAAQPNQARLFVYLIPQAVPLAVPIGLMVGILFGLRGHRPSIQSTRTVLTMAVVSSVMSFAVLAWLLPAANQSYRERVAEGLGVARGTLTKGMNEMTLAELSGQIDSYRGTAMAGSRLVRNLAFSYHLRWSLAGAAAVLAFFALGVLARRLSARWLLGLTAVGACVAYYLLLELGQSATRGGTIPAFAGAWLPNVIFVLLSATLLKITSEPRPSCSGS